MEPISPPACDTKHAARAPAGRSAGVEEPPGGLLGILLDSPRVSRGLSPRNDPPQRHPRRPRSGSPSERSARSRRMSPESRDAPEDLPKEAPRQVALGQREHEVPCMPDQPPAGLEEPLLEARQGPALNRKGESEPTQERG